jgi:hypothetical protein
MRRYLSVVSFLAFALALTTYTLETGCSSGSMAPKSTGSAVPMTLTMGDTPPNGVAVVFFEAMITGVSLQPSDTSKSAVSVLLTPTEVEMSHLQTNRAFLSLTKVPPDTYSSMTITFSNAALTIVDHSGAAVGSCANNTTCELSPSFNPSMATITAAPFPVTISANSVVGVRLDFDVNSSVQTDLSISPTVTVKKVTVKREDEDEDQMEQLDDIDGQVSAVGTNQFTLTNEQTGQSFTISADSNTVFEDFGASGCTASPANFSCIQQGQVLSVDLSENGMGTMLAKRVELEENANGKAIKGTITSVDSTTQFHMVVFNEEPAVNGVAEGSPVIVTIASGATFQIGRQETGEDGGFSISGASFASGADLMVGQDVQIRPGTVSTSGSVTTITTNLVRLRPSQVTGQVGTNGGNGSFPLTGLSPLFTGATPPVTTINVVTLSGADMEDFSGTMAPAAGNTVSVRGLLFNTPTTPTLVTRMIREDNHD